MTKTLDDQSRDVLSYRPNISFVEPDQVPGVIEPIKEPVQIKEVVDKKRKVKDLANAVNALATAVQVKADLRAKDMTVRLDSKVDAGVIASVKRMYGHDAIDPTVITYEQYKQCKDRLLNKGIEIGQKVQISPDEVLSAREEVITPNTLATGQKPNARPKTNMGGFGTPASKDGGLRPELDNGISIIEPLDIEVLNAYLVRIFVNSVWEKLLLPVVSDLPVIGDILKDLNPLVEIPSDGYSAQELVNLGIPVIGYEKKEEESPTPPSAGGQ